MLGVIHKKTAERYKGFKQLQKNQGLKKFLKNFNKTSLGVLLTVSLAFTVAPAASADDDDESTGEELLEQQTYAGGSCQMSEFMQDSAAATYNSLTERIDPHGMAATSLTELYPAGLMYLRDGSAQALAMIEAGDTEAAMPLIRYILQYSLASGFTREGEATLPHRVPKVVNKKAKSQEETNSIAYSSNDENQETKNILVATVSTGDLGTKQLTRIDIPLQFLDGAVNSLTLRVFAGEDDPMQISTVKQKLTGATKWVRFDLPPPGYPASKGPKELLFVVSPSDATAAQIEEAKEQYKNASNSGASDTPEASDPLDTVSFSNTKPPTAVSPSVTVSPSETMQTVSNDTPDGLSTDEEGDDGQADESEQTDETTENLENEEDTSDEEILEDGSLEEDNSEEENSEKENFNEESHNEKNTDLENTDNFKPESIKPNKSTFSVSGDLRWMGSKTAKPAFRAYTDSKKFKNTDLYNGNDNHKLGSGDTWDEMDENMHVFYAWAQYVLKTNDQEFLDDTWPAVSNFLEFYLDKNVYWLDPKNKTSTNLLKNPRLDAVGYHDGVYDLVTNVFAASVFDSLDQISQTYAAFPNASKDGNGLKWSSLNKALNAGIKKHLIKKVNGKDVYIPWLKPNKTADLKVGAIWVSLIPNAIDWNGFDDKIMRNTLDRYRAENSFNFGGVQMLNARYSKKATPTIGTGGTAKKYTGQWVLLKSLSWEYKFESSKNNKKRLDEISLWIGNYFPSTKVPAPESWIVNYPAQIPVRDGGNQEHSSWYVSSLLKAFPGCADAIVQNAGGYTPPPHYTNIKPIAHERFWGNDRTQTSTAAALGVYEGKNPDSVYLARGDNYVDAISGGALSDGPIILLSRNGSINTDITRALKKLKPKRVVALGGTGVISNATLNKAAKAAGSKKTRLAGNDRFGTAAAIATESFAQAKKFGKKHTTLYLADGMGPGNTGSPDAVSAGGLTDGATVLINPNSKKLPASTRTVIAKLKPDKVIALGGVAVVNSSVLAEAKKVAGSATKSSRLFGQDRYETSVAIAGHAAKYHAREVILVRGDELADSVTAGGVGRGPILLTQSKIAPPSVINEVKRIRPWKVNVLGGEAVLSNGVVNKIRRAAVETG